MCYLFKNVCNFKATLKELRFATSSTWKSPQKKPRFLHPKLPNTTPLAVKGDRWYIPGMFLSTSFQSQGQTTVLCRTISKYKVWGKLMLYQPMIYCYFNLNLERKQGPSKKGKIYVCLRTWSYSAGHCGVSMFSHASSTQLFFSGAF